MGGCIVEKNSLKVGMTWRKEEEKVRNFDVSVGVVFDPSKGTNELFRMAKEIKNGGGESRLVSSWRSLI